MYDVKDLMFLYALTFTHVGSGDDLNYIDLPIQREKHTNLPKIEASSLKGSIKQAMEESVEQADGDINDVYALLGNDDNGEIASAVSFSDAKLLFFPVKSAKGIFAYVTCPLVIKRFLSDCKMVGIPDMLSEESEWLSGQNCYIPSTDESTIVFSKKEVVLDEYVFNVQENKEFSEFVSKISKKLPKNDMLTIGFSSRVILIGDDDFAYFTKYSTEVITRIKIGKETGTVEGGALFTQENLPPETILYSLLFFTNSKKNKSMDSQAVKNEFDDIFKTEIFQIGGDMTLGKGLFHKRMWIGGEINNDTNKK